MGSIRIRILTSSTCVTVHRLHGLKNSKEFASSNDKTAALSRYLHGHCILELCLNKTGLRFIGP